MITNNNNSSRKSIVIDVFWFLRPAVTILVERRTAKTCNIGFLLLKRLFLKSLLGLWIGIQSLVIDNFKDKTSMFLLLSKNKI